jgi:hypothetical protein
MRRGSSGSSEVERLMQEQRSREAKKAVARFIPIQLAMPFQQNPSPSGLSILLSLSLSLD